MKSGIESANKEGMFFFLVSLSSYLLIFCIFSDSDVFKLLKTVTSLCWQACFSGFFVPNWSKSSGLCFGAT